MEVFDAIANVTVAVTGRPGRSKLHHAVNWGLSQRDQQTVKAFFARALSPGPQVRKLEFGRDASIERINRRSAPR
jgi:thiamine monophosphate kinase